jgi:hypothetical protein
LATDKTLFPRAAPVVVDTRVGLGLGGQDVPFLELMFDQDTGGGIRTAEAAAAYFDAGVERIVELQLLPAERAALDKSIAAVKDLVAAMNRLTGTA